jgi:hypothetical protein
MAEMMRLIDAKDFDFRVSQKSMTEVFPDWKELPVEIQDAVCKHGRHLHMMLETQPAVDAVPVVHGRWKKRGNETECSVCRFIYYANRDIFNYCPNCGAKMDTQRLREPVKEVAMHHIGDFEDKQESGLLEE